MIVFHLDYAYGRDASEIKAAVRPIRQRVSQRLQDETIRLLQVHGELAFTIVAQRVKMRSGKEKHVVQTLAGLEFLDPLAYLSGAYESPLSIPFALLQARLLKLTRPKSYFHACARLNALAIVILLTRDVKAFLPPGATLTAGMVPPGPLPKDSYKVHHTATTLGGRQGCLPSAQHFFR